MFGKKSKEPAKPKRLDYDVLYAITINGLIKEVDQAVAEGFEPLGGVSHDGAHHCQAMIRRNTTN